MDEPPTGGDENRPPTPVDGRHRVVAVEAPPGRSLAHVLRRAGFDVTPTAPVDALSVARRADADVVVVAVEEPRAALRLIADLVEQDPAVSVVVVGLPDDQADFLAAVRAGAVGYLAGDVSEAALARAVDGAAHGRTSFPRDLTRSLVVAFHEGVHHLGGSAGSRPADLSDREWEVLQLLWQGRTTREIAERLFLAPATVRSHLARLRRHLGVATTADLAALLDRSHGGAGASAEGVGREDR